MMKHYGRLTIIISVVMLLPSFIPGAMSVLAYYFSIATFASSVMTIEQFGVVYFRANALIAAFGAIVVNDYLRLIGSLEAATWIDQAALYSMYLIVLLFGICKAKNLNG
ncbi:hypothetical protein [Pseudoalteromonas luteoviolacea]|uniref:Uncharacterized protein n=1 Tax=Pseudoalteromonas luteoviolacea S4060-1 TaxID=1365257 RepID=A0A161YK42_9GAMM|nr:hypothetical protein [Pseudoalteromonas luteoviolacea]KZN61690.1 hypothetical protein N478_06395 [Pseudoalteromonas luteoviolacea S4060-1]